MMTYTGWSAAGQITASGHTHGEICDRLDALGCTCIRDSQGGIIRKLAGAWYYL